MQVNVWYLLKAIVAYPLLTLGVLGVVTAVIPTSTPAGAWIGFLLAAAIALWIVEVPEVTSYEDGTYWLRWLVVAALLTVLQLVVMSAVLANVVAGVQIIVASIITHLLWDGLVVNVLNWAKAPKFRQLNTPA